MTLLTPEGRARWQMRAGLASAISREVTRSALAAVQPAPDMVGCLAFRKTGIQSCVEKEALSLLKGDHAGGDKPSQGSRGAEGSAGPAA